RPAQRRHRGVHPRRADRDQAEAERAGHQQVLRRPHQRPGAMSADLPRLIVRRRVDDTESPVSAMLKLNPMQPGLVLFESVMGGETRGRYSFIGMAPDLWWRVRGGKAET